MTKIIDIRNETPRTNGTRYLSSIKKIARHHSGSKTGDWKSFWAYWKTFKKWGTGGYHEIILRDGSVQLCYNPNEITNGIGKHNSYVYHICVVGNGSFTEAQEKTWNERALYNMKLFNLKVEDIKGHNEFVGTSTKCPGIDMNLVRSRLQTKPWINYTVKKGDTLSKICQTNDNDVLQKVADLNNLRNKDMIRINQVLKIPVELVE
jgi:hypothetical protein